jgi:hypothetical protein
VLILLPPSEAKRPDGDGSSVGARPVLSTPMLAPARVALLRAIRRAAKDDPDALAAGLKLPASAAAEALAANRAAGRSPTLPALDRYTGVLFTALGAGTLSPVARRTAEKSVLVFSGLWGVVRGSDLVPAYRVPASGVIPGFGGVTAHWRQPLASVVPELIGDQPVVDLRSTDYAGMWRPGSAVHEQHVAVRVLADRGSGEPRPVSYQAKTVKGEVARFLVTDRHRWADPLAAVRAAAEALDLRVLERGTGPGGHQIDLVGRYG